jgi:hypothetical protein
MHRLDEDVDAFVERNESWPGMSGAEGRVDEIDRPIRERPADDPGEPIEIRVPRHEGKGRLALFACR